MPVQGQKMRLELLVVLVSVLIKLEGVRTSGWPVNMFIW
jgi:hypothetical protein